MTTIRRTHPPATSPGHPHSPAPAGPVARGWARRALATTAGVLVAVTVITAALCWAGSVTAWADEQPAHSTRTHTVRTDTAQPGTARIALVHAIAPIRGESNPGRGYWCVPGVSRSERSRGGYSSRDLDDLVNLVDVDDLDQGRDAGSGRRRDGGDRTVWLDGGRGQDWPLDIGGLGIQVRISTDTTATDRDRDRDRDRDWPVPSGGSAQREDGAPDGAPSRPRCRVVPSSQTRTDPDNNRWGCVLTDRDTTRPGTTGAPVIERSTDRRSGRVIVVQRGGQTSEPDSPTWPDELLSPSDDGWWPMTGTTSGDRPPPLSPITSSAGAPAARAKPSATGQRCLMLWPGAEGTEVHLGQLSPVSPPRTR